MEFKYKNIKGGKIRERHGNYGLLGREIKCSCCKRWFIYPNGLKQHLTSKIYIPKCSNNLKLIRGKNNEN